MSNNFDQSVKRQILAAYGYASEGELNAAIEDAFPGYLAAHAEWEVEKAAFTAELQDRMEEVAAAVTAWGQAHGMLPDGVELVPIDLQADAQWMAPAAWTQEANVPEPPDVLARIDSAIEDWELGADAARWNPDASEPEPEPQYVGLLAATDGVYTPRPRMWIGDHEVPITDATWTEVRMETRPAPWPGVRPIRMAAEFQRQTEALVEGRLMAGALEMTGSLEGFIAAMTSACESILALSRTLRLEPWPHGWNEPCFCHPKPFPAAQDYRRRTRHRNRRRKA